MKKTCLHIDTSERHSVMLSLLVDGKKTAEKNESVGEKNAQRVLRLTEEFLHEQNLDIFTLDEISCSTGPGSYTGLRVGAATAMVLSYILSLPVNGKPPGSLVNLEYGNDLFGIHKPSPKA